MAISGIPLFVSSHVTNAAVYGLLTTLTILISQFSDWDKSREFVSSLGGHWAEEHFDFIIIGAGSAGSVLANRLSRKFKVLVLEAGGQPHPLMNIPILTFPMEAHPDYDWMFQTVPQTNACLGLNGHRSRWPRGKAEGGSSNLNALIYLRGHPKDFDSWAQNLEDPIWRYQNLVNFYKKLENFQDTNPAHGHGGEQDVETGSYDELVEAFLKAGREFGYPPADLNSYHTEGFAPLTFTSHRGLRFENYFTFLKPAKESSFHRLSVYKYSTALRILLDRSKRAYGVEYLRFGLTRRAYASKEVIVSGGSVKSPQILMLSGIGPRAHLQSLGIPVIADLPVGLNLQDHVGSIVGMFAVDKPLTISVGRDANINTFIKYFKNGEGALNSSLVHAVASITTKFEKGQPEKWPDVQITLVASSQPPFYESLLNYFNIAPPAVRDLWGLSAGLNTFQFFVINARPSQRGFIRLISRNPYDPPLIDPMYLQNTRDVNVTVEGIKLAARLVTSTNAFRRVGAKLLKLPLQPCAHMRFGSDAYWECYLRHLTMTLYHPCCTCPMGRRSDPNRVLDSNFRVVGGIKNLRVIDASAFPTIPTSNLNAPTNLMGEVGSYLICKQWTGYAC